MRHSDYHIVDSSEIGDYYASKYGIRPAYIPYGASLCREEQEGCLESFGVTEGDYYLLMARMEPENHVETILEGFAQTRVSRKFLVIGNTANRYGSYLKRRFAGDTRIAFLGSLFDQDAVHTLRRGALLYFHGHSVGGTNPSLLEAMASRVTVAAHDNPFNRAVLADRAWFFSSAGEVSALVDAGPHQIRMEWMKANRARISDHFNWSSIVDHYHEFLCLCYHEFRTRRALFPQGQVQPSLPRK